MDGFIWMQDLVEETKKNSGLDEKALSNQPGNNPSQTFGTTELKTGRGQSAAGKSFLVGHAGRYDP